MSNTTTVIGTADPALAATLFWTLAAGTVQLIAIVRTVRLPAEHWSYGRWSKAAAIFGSGWLVWQLGLISVPIGAAAVIWHTRTLVRKLAARPAATDLPMAEGADEPQGQGR